jgi:predicted DNA-binding protein (MmcQ/YjbR family)
MNIEVFREYCLSFPGTTEDMPFGDQTLVFKVAGKIFALTGLEPFERINLKCDPEYAVELREQYDGVIIPGYHMNKKHWNTIQVADLSHDFVLELTKHSYDLVRKGLAKKVREELEKD